MVELQDDTIIRFQSVDNGCLIQVTDYVDGAVSSQSTHTYQDDKESKLSHTERLRDFLRMLNEMMSVDCEGQKIEIKIVPE